MEWHTCSCEHDVFECLFSTEEKEVKPFGTVPAMLTFQCLKCHQRYVVEGEDIDALRLKVVDFDRNQWKLQGNVKRLIITGLKK
jgi:hypothetical protein